MPGDWRQAQLTGIMVNPGRQQPYTVWRKGCVLAFCRDRFEAEAKLVDGGFVFRRPLGLAPLGLTGVRR